MTSSSLPGASGTLTAFAGFERLARGGRQEVFAQLRQYTGSAPLLIFDDTSGALVDLDLREPTPDASASEPEPAPESAPRSVGRPKLGVVAREVTLLPRHWDWLSRQPGGASVALRRLVEEARRIHQGRDAVRESREAAYRFMTAMAGSLEGFEEAARALFAGDAAALCRFGGGVAYRRCGLFAEAGCGFLERRRCRLLTWWQLLPAAPRPLWRVFAAFLAPMLASNISAVAVGHAQQHLPGADAGGQGPGSRFGLFPGDVFLHCLHDRPGCRCLGADRPGLGRGQGGAGAGRGWHDAGGGPCLWLVVAVLGGSFTGTMLRALGTPPDILPDATQYARIILIAMPGLFVFLLATAMLRGVGDTVTPLYTLLISAGIGLVLTPALIRGWAGLPQLGVASGAAATVVSFVVATTWLGWRLMRLHSPLAPGHALAAHLRIDWGLLRAVLRVGVPTGVQMIVVSLAEIALLGLVNGYGSQATAAYGAVNQVVAYVQFPAISIAITTSILGAQAIGAGRLHTLGAIVRTALWMNVVLTGTLVLLGYLFSRTLMGFFIISAGCGAPS
jgi:hypothetical protein